MEPPTERGELLEALVRRAGPTTPVAAHRLRPAVPAIVAAVLAVVVGVVAWRLVARPVPIEERMPMAEAPASPGAASGTANTAGAASDHTTGPATTQGTALEETSDEPVTVHVAGAVAAPGVVRLPGGSRVVDAVAAAGGMRPEADPQRMNLAAPLVDGSRIVVPALGMEIPPEVPTSVAAAAGGSGGTAGGSSGPGAAGATPGAPVDLNSATAEQLDSLPGVGPSTAAAILAHREANGPFRSVEELLDVRGIGEAKLEALRDLVVVGG